MQGSHVWRGMTVVRGGAACGARSPCGLADGFVRFRVVSGLEMRSGVHSMRIFNPPITYEFKEIIEGERGMHRMNYRCA